VEITEKCKTKIKVKIINKNSGEKLKKSFNIII